MTRALLVLALVVAAAPSHAADSATPPALSLAEAWQDALAHDAGLAAALAEAEAEGLRAQAQQRAARPRLDLLAQASRQDQPAAVFAHKLDAGEFGASDFAIERLNAPDALSHLTTRAGLLVPIEVFGRNRAASQARTALAEMRAAQAQETRQDLRLAVAQAYHAAVLAERALDVLRAALAGARAREDEAAAHAEEGTALPADLLRARARRRQREADLAAAEGEQRSARARLATWIGRSAEQAWTLARDLSADLPRSAETLAAWRARALRDRAQVLVARGGHQAATATHAVERLGARPELSGWAQVQDDRNRLGSGRVSWGLGVQARWTAFDATRSRRIAASQADVRAAELRERQAREQVALEVETAFFQAEAAETRQAAAAGGAEEGREALRVVRERRAAGLATLTDELETEAASLAAALEELRAESAASLAIAVLRRAAGVL
jgi:outer membrane protein TolC